MTPDQMRDYTKLQLHNLTPTAKEELRAWFANKIQIAAGSDFNSLTGIMREFNELIFDKKET